MPFLSVPPRFWALLGLAFFAVFAWRATRRWWRAYKDEVRDGWTSGRS